jgi:succinate-semialdehyde dehydrogenase/glutarate-semialdehyde dehydrogenase
MNQLKNKSLFKQQCYVAGKWIDATSKKTFPVDNPFDNSPLGTVPDFDTADCQKAIAAANAAWPAWRALTAKERGDLLWRWAELIRANKEDLAIIMTLEQGKPLTESRGEVDYGNSFIEWFAEEGRRVYGDIISSNKANQHLLVIKQPIGVVAAIAPWNFPIAMITRKCAPALAAGCPVVIKPAEATPYSVGGLS